LKGVPSYTKGKRHESTKESLPERLKKEGWLKARGYGDILPAYAFIMYTSGTTKKCVELRYIGLDSNTLNFLGMNNDESCLTSSRYHRC